MRIAVDGVRSAERDPRGGVLRQTAVVGEGSGDEQDIACRQFGRFRTEVGDAGLDVTEPEPLPAASPLWSEPKCLITPHVAGGNHLESTERRIIAIALGNVRCYANGQSLDNRMPLKG